MKKQIFKVMLGLTLVFALLVSCAQTNATTTTQSETTIEETTQKETKYKDTLLAYDQLIQGKKLLLLQNALIYSRDGFYIESTAPQTETIKYKDSDVSAYKMRDVTQWLLNGVDSDIKVVTKEGNTVSVSSDTFNNFNVILGNLEEGKDPILYNVAEDYEILNFKYAITQENEVIYSIVSEEEKNIQELLKEVSWDINKTYRLMATDYFYVPVDESVAKTGMLIGTLSGAINANLPDIKVMKNGKINDIMYIEELNEVAESTK